MTAAESVSEADVERGGSPHALTRADPIKRHIVGDSFGLSMNKIRRGVIRFFLK